MASPIVRGKPGTYEELRAVLSASTASLPKRLRQVAVFVTQHPNEMAMETISSVAGQIGVQPSTLVRFAQIFGFSGFSEFQDLFKSHVKAGRPGTQESEGQSGKRETPDHPISGLIAAGLASLSRLDAELDAGEMAKCVSVLANAAQIHVIGSKRAFAVAHYVSLTLSQQGIANRLIANIGSSAFDEVSCIQPGDAVLAISFSPYNSVTPDLALLGRQRGAAVISITDSAVSPLVDVSDGSIIVIEHADRGYRTLAATMVVALGLVIEVAAARLDQSKRTIPKR
jgi:DNA-binding MurR/RpiR family transcriptional regulator